MHRRDLLPVLYLLFALGAPAAAQAQPYPAKPVRIVIPYPAGGPVDAIGRRLAEALQRQTGQPFVIDNRSGASGSIGADAVAKAAPDGYTLLLTIPDALINVASIIRNLPYDPRKDFAFVTQVASSGAALMADPDLQAGSLAELERAARAKPGLAFGSWGPGSYPHVLGQAMVRKSGIAYVHVPYRGVAPAVQDLLGHQIGFTFGPSNLAQQYAQKGQARVLAVAGPRRSALLPQVPTFAEQGYTDAAFQLTAWVGLLAPAATPKAVTEELQRQVGTTLKDPEFVRFLAATGFEPIGSSAQQFQQDFEREFPLVNALIKSTGLTPE